MDETNQPAPAEKSAREQMAEWVAAYKHGLEHNAPRTQAELDRLLAIVGPLEDEDEKIKALAAGH